jgi:ABC-type dipeptide/oligopeptide/nickel transport system permease subunit
MLAQMMANAPNFVTNAKILGHSPSAAFFRQALPVCILPIFSDRAAEA